MVLKVMGLWPVEPQRPPCKVLPREGDPGDGQREAPEDMCGWVSWGLQGLLEARPRSSLPRGRPHSLCPGE